MEEPQGAWNTSLVQNSKRLIIHFTLPCLLQEHEFCQHPRFDLCRDVKLRILIKTDAARVQAASVWSRNTTDDRNRSSHQQIGKKINPTTTSAAQSEMK